MIIQIFNGGSLLLNVLYYYLLRNWKVIMWVFYALPALLTLISTVLFMVDTPICLVLRNSAERSLKGFLFIAKLNKVTDHNLSS